MATYSVQTAASSFMSAGHHQFSNSHTGNRMQFGHFEVPLTDTANNSHATGSDCGSSSGLGGMKTGEGGCSDDSASNQDDEVLRPGVINAAMASSKKSAASSGKGSSTGTSHAGSNRNKTRNSPKHQQQRQLHLQSTPCTSNSTVDLLGSISSNGASKATTSTPSGSIVSLNGSADFASSTPSYPPPSYPHLMVSSAPNHPQPPLYTMTVSPAGQLLDINRSIAPANAAAAVTTNGQSIGNRPNSNNNGPTVAAANIPATSGQAASNSSSTGGGRNSASPDGATQLQLANSTSQHRTSDLYVHVQPGETLAIRVGADIQQISGPATVRMVSQNGMAPSALPLHVPPGHMIQQIVDEHGILRHLILSPETTPTGIIPNGPFGLSSIPIPPPPTINPNTPVPPSGSATPQPLNLQQSTVTPPPGVPPFPPPPAPLTFTGPQPQMVTVEDGQHVCSQNHSTYENAGYGLMNVRPNHWSPPPGTGSRTGKLSHDEEADISQNSQSGASGVEDEETERIREMLNCIQAPAVLDVNVREAEISWQELDTSEASAPGGPFPQIDASEFTYEVVLFERRPDAPICKKICCTPEQGNTLRLNQLKPDTDYYVRLRALLAERGLLGDQSDAVGFKTKPTHPDKPLAPRLQKKAKSWLALHWKRPCENGASISLYKLEMDQEANSDREQSEEFCVVYEGVMESAKISRLQPNTLYRFRLNALNKYGQSEYSDLLLVQTNGAAPKQPEPPQLLLAQSNSLQLAWAKRTGDDYFTLQMEDPTNAYGFLPTTANTTETVAILSDLRRFSEYRFRLLAHNDDGESQPSEIVTYATLPDRPPPPPKPYLKDRVKANCVSLAWDPPKDTGGAAINCYQLEYSLDQGGNSQNWKTAFSGNGRGCVVNELIPGQSYQFRLLVSSSAGQSTCSPLLDVTTPPVSPGQCPLPELVGRPKSTSLYIRWALPSSTGGAPIGDFEVSIGDSLQSMYRGVKNECQIGGLQPGRSYHLKARAHNRAGAGNWSQALEVMTAAGPPSNPTDLRLQSDATDRSLSLIWDIPLENNGAPIHEYRIFRAVKRSISLHIPDAETLAERRASFSSCEEIKSDSLPPSPTNDYGDSVHILTTSNTSGEIKNLTPATDYAFKVLAVNSAGLSDFSSVLSCRTIAGVPSAPLQLHCEPTSTTELDVNWMEAMDNGSPLVSYLLELSSNEDRRQFDTIQLPAHLHQFLLEGLQPETSYRIRVCAANDEGIGNSATVSAATFSMPPPPPILECVNTAAVSLKLRWQDARNSALNDRYYYHLEKENENGSYSPVYEGECKSVKVQRLAEFQRYRFRIRASTTTGGIGDWSEPVEFATGRLPPPTVKSAPKVTEVAEGSYQVEWQGVRVSGMGNDKIQYRLQTAIGAGRGTDRTDEWKTAYQGSAQSYTLSGQTHGSTFRVRIAAIRVSQDQGSAIEETAAQPSPAATINLPPTPTKQRRSSEGSELTASDMNIESVQLPERLLSDGGWAILILAGFSLLALLLAFFVQSYMSD